jgi:hypothetical protein
MRFAAATAVVGVSTIALAMLAGAGENIFDRDTQKLNAALDEALELTFAASDPIAVTAVKEADSA